MPKVGDKEFSYTPEGMEAAKQESIITGEAVEKNDNYEYGGMVTDARDRKTITQGFSNNMGEDLMAPMKPMFGHGGAVKKSTMTENAVGQIEGKVYKK